MMTILDGLVTKSELSVGFNLINTGTVNCLIMSQNACKMHHSKTKNSPVRDCGRLRTPLPPGKCYCNCKAFANWTETLPSSKSRDTKTRTDIKNLLHTKVRYCSVVSEPVVTCQLSLKMPEEIDFENWRISNFKGLVTLTLTLDRVIWHTVLHHSSTSTCIPNFIGIGKTFCGRRMYGRTDGRTDIWPMLLGRHFGVDLKIQKFSGDPPHTPPHRGGDTPSQTAPPSAPQPRYSRSTWPLNENPGSASSCVNAVQSTLQNYITAQFVLH